MDFRSCPDCKASVLEEDVDECPFCGASMSGKPSKASAPKPTPAKPAAKSPAAAGPAASGAAKPGAGQRGPAKSDPARPVAGGKPGTPKPTRPSTEKPGAPASDDPFDVDTSALRRAVKLAPKPVKGRTLEVVCPMCETPGYMQPSDAGKDVHCCNPACLVPVFKTQKPKVEVAAAPKESKLNPLVLGGGAVAAIALGIGVYVVLFAKPEVVQQNLGPAENTAPEVIPDLVPKNTIVRQEEKPPMTLADIKKNSLTSIVERARQRDKNRHAEYGFQLAAESFAAVGDLPKAREQLGRLQAAGPSVAYLQIEPLVEVAWSQIQAGKKAEAVQTAQDALSKAKNLPKTIRKTHDGVISLVALLVAVDLVDEANNLIEQEADFGARGLLSLYWRCAMDARTYDINRESQFTWHTIVPHPLRMGAVETLVARNQTEAALKFAGSGRSGDSHAACRAAWAGRLLTLRPSEAVTQITAAIDAGQFDAATQTQIWASVSDAARSLKDTATAAASLEKAKAALATLPAPSVLKFPSMKQVHDSESKPHAGLPDPAPAKSAALAASQIALAELRAGRTDAAIEPLTLALNFFRAMTPSPAVTKARLDACQNQESTVRADLAKALNLPNTEDRIRIPFSRYRTQCRKLNELAEHRLELQVTLLRAAALSGFEDGVWKVATERQSAEESEREPYLQTSLPSLIQSLADANGLTELAAKVKSAFTQKALTPDPLDQILATTRQHVATGKISAASTVLEKAYRSALSKRFPFHLDLIAMEIGGRVQESQPPAQSVAFIQALYDLLIQEDLFQLLAGDSVRRGLAPELWKLTENSRALDALEFVAIYRGFISGITGMPTTSAEAPAATRN